MNATWTVLHIPHQEGPSIPNSPTSIEILMTVSVEPRVNVVFISSMPNRCNLASITAAALLLATLPRPSMGKDPHISTIDVIPKQHRVNVNVHGGGCDFTLTIAIQTHEFHDRESKMGIEGPPVGVKCPPVTSLSDLVGKPRPSGTIEAYAASDPVSHRSALECKRNHILESTWWEPRRKTLRASIKRALEEGSADSIPLPDYDHICTYINDHISDPTLEAAGPTINAALASYRTSSGATTGLSLPFVNLNSRDYAEIKVVGSALGITTKVTVGKCSLSRSEVLPSTIVQLQGFQRAKVGTFEKSTPAWVNPVALLPANRHTPPHGLCIEPARIDSGMAACGDCEAFADWEENKLDCEFPLPSGKAKFTYTFPSGMVDAEYHALQNQLAEMKNIGALARLWKKAVTSVDQLKDAIEEERTKLDRIAKKICKALRSVLDWEKVNKISHRQRDQVVRAAKDKLELLKRSKDEEDEMIRKIR